MIEKYIESERGRVYYWTNDIESKVALLMLHGLTTDHHLFDGQVKGLTNRYKMIIPDLPLHGSSKTYEDFTYANVVEELIAILEKEAIKEVVVVGQSAGGFVGQAMAEIYPDRLKGFVGVGTTPFGKKYYSWMDRFFLKHMSTLIKLYPFDYYCKICANAVTYSEEARQSMHTSLRVLGKVGVDIAVKSIYGELLKAKDEVLFNCPVLLTFGEHDKTGYVQKYNKVWAKKCGYELKVIKDAAHNANYDNYELFNEMLNEFIEEK